MIRLLDSIDSGEAVEIEWFVSSLFVDLYGEIETKDLILSILSEESYTKEEAEIIMKAIEEDE